MYRTSNGISRKAELQRMPSLEDNGGWSVTACIGLDLSTEGLSMEVDVLLPLALGDRVASVGL